jgi:hypothetical protein
MGKHKWSVAVIALCLQCGGSTPPAAPVEAPEEPSTEAPSPTEPETGEPEATPSDTPAEAPAESDGGTSAAKKKCEELDKTTCKITTGCGWNDVKKCVEEGASE